MFDLLKPFKTVLTQNKIIQKLCGVYALYFLGFWGVLKAYWWTETDVHLIANPYNFPAAGEEPLKHIFYEIFSFFSAAQDIFPLPQLMGIFCLTGASVIVLQSTKHSLSIQNLILSLGIGLNPYLLPFFSGHFDMFPNALALLFAVIPFLYWDEKPLYFSCAAAACLSVCLLLCPIMTCFFIVLFAFKILQDTEAATPRVHINLCNVCLAVVLCLMACGIYPVTFDRFLGGLGAMIPKSFDLLKQQWFWTHALSVRPGTPAPLFDYAPTVMGVLMLLLTVLGITGSFQKGEKGFVIKIVCWAVMLFGLLMPVIFGGEAQFVALGLIMFLMIISAPNGKIFNVLNALFLGGICLYALHNSTPLAWKDTLPVTKKMAYLLFWTFEIGFSGLLAWGIWRTSKTRHLYLIALWWVWSCLVFFIHYGNLLIVQKHFIVFKLESVLSDLATFPYHQIMFSGQPLQNPIVIEKAKEYPLMGQLIRTYQNDTLGQYVRAFMVPDLEPCSVESPKRDMMPLIQTPGHSLYLLNDTCVVIRLFNAPIRDPHKEY